MSSKISYQTIKYLLTAIILSYILFVTSAKIFWQQNEIVFPLFAFNLFDKIPQKLSITTLIVTKIDDTEIDRIAVRNATEIFDDANEAIMRKIIKNLGQAARSGDLEKENKLLAQVNAHLKNKHSKISYQLEKWQGDLHKIYHHSQYDSIQVIKSYENH